jgi:hypothetical protein
LPDRIAAYIKDQLCSRSDQDTVFPEQPFQSSLTIESDFLIAKRLPPP